MHVLILNWRDIKNPKSGGAEIVTFEHAKGWVKNGHTVTWFCSMFKNGKEFEKIEGVNFVRGGNSLSVYFFAVWFYLFSKNTFDLVIDEIHGLPFFTPLYVRKPKIAFIHEVAGEIWDYMYPFPLNTVGKFIEKTYFLLYKHIPFWTDANSTRKELATFGIPFSQIKVILCPIRPPLKKKKFKKEKNLTCIFVSRLVKMKGVDEVIKAFGFIHKEHPQARLWVVGRGEKRYMRRLQTMIKEYKLQNVVSFFGNVSEKEKYDLLSRAHILLHASVKEGWGLVVIEAASQGTPAVVYNVGGLRDSVKNNKTGIVLSTNSPWQMGHDALMLFNDKKKYNLLQKNAIAFAKSLTWEDAISKSLSLLGKVGKK